MVASKLAAERPPVFLSVLFASGFTSLAYEVVLIREMAILLGPTEFASALVLSSFMAGLALGAYFLGKMSEKAEPVGLLVKVELALAAMGLVLLPLLRTLRIISNPILLFPAAFVLMLAPAFFMGGEIPIVSKILNRDQKTAKWVGLAYASDTVGGIFGSLAAGLLLLPFFGSFKVFLLGSFLNAAAALFVIFRKRLVRLP